MADTHELLKRLRAFWAAQDVGTGVPVSNSEIAAHERLYGITLPADLRAYFLAINGMDRHEEQSLEWDDALIRFYPLQEFVPADVDDPGTKAPDASDLFVFADYSIWVWGYAVRMRGEGLGEVCALCDTETVRVAGSFTEFLELYVARDDRAIQPL